MSYISFYHSVHLINTAYDPLLLLSVTVRSLDPSLIILNASTKYAALDSFNQGLVRHNTIVCFMYTRRKPIETGLSLKGVYAFVSVII